MKKNSNWCKTKRLILNILSCHCEVVYTITVFFYSLLAEFCHPNAHNKSFKLLSPLPDTKSGLWDFETILQFPRTTLQQSKWDWVWCLQDSSNDKLRLHSEVQSDECLHNRLESTRDLHYLRSFPSFLKLSFLFALTLDVIIKLKTIGISHG